MTIFFLSTDFKINPDVKLACKDAAVFFGLVTSAFEGVGTVSSKLYLKDNSPVLSVMLEFLTTL